MVYENKLVCFGGRYVGLLEVMETHYQIRLRIIRVIRAQFVQIELLVEHLYSYNKYLINFPFFEYVTILVDLPALLYWLIHIGP